MQNQNRAHQLIEDFMIAANGVTARYLAKMNFPSIRRVVRVPQRWDRIVDLAHDCCGEPLPAVPDSKALEAFLLKMKEKDPIRFPDLSLSVIKLMGSGEYVAEAPGEEAIGHFGLAVQDYSHSTAPNRRYPDVITQRLLKNALKGEKPPYTKAELDSLASQCTNKEDIVNRVERSVRKSAAAMLLENKINQHFDAIVTGASEKGTWVRVLGPPVEGKLVQGFMGVDVGDRIGVKLVHVDAERGFIDFAREKKQAGTIKSLNSKGPRMVKMIVEYTGELHSKILHEPSGTLIQTDAPKDNMGKGESFSPTDLVGAALGSCIATTIAIFSLKKSKNWDLRGMRVVVEKEMNQAPDRKIARLPVQVWLSATISEEDRKVIERVAKTCPVHHSLHPEIDAPITFHWG